MGLHFPFGYVGHETAFLNTFIDLLDNFCSGCHTDEDVGGDCRKCPVGQLVYASKEYIEGAYESAHLRKEANLIKKIKKEIKKIKPYPHFNGNWIFDSHRNKDKLLPLRELLKDLMFFHEQFVHPFTMEEKMRIRIYKEMDKLKKKIKTKG